MIAFVLNFKYKNNKTESQKIETPFWFIDTLVQDNKAKLTGVVKIKDDKNKTRRD